MIEALWYGFVVSLSFIGFVSVIYLILLHTYSPLKYGNIVINLTRNPTENEIYNAVIGLHLYELLFGNGTSANIIILNSKNDAVFVYDICNSSGCLSNFTCITYDEFLIMLNQED